MNLIGEKISYKPDEQFHLNDVSFNFKKGNLYTILGRTLSGKTTLLKTIIYERSINYSCNRRFNFFKT